MPIMVYLVMMVADYLGTACKVSADGSRLVRLAELRMRFVDAASAFQVLLLLTRLSSASFSSLRLKILRSLRYLRCYSFFNAWF